MWGAAGVAWAVGFVSNFLVAPTNTGMGVVGSYAAFEPGSKVGNVGALLLWTGVSARAARHFSRSTGPLVARVLAGFAIPALLSVYPSAVVSHAVGHLVPIEDGFVYGDWLALPLVLAGVAAMVAAGIAALISRRR